MLSNMVAMGIPPTITSLVRTSSTPISAMGIKINAVAYADDLSLYTESHGNMEHLLVRLEAFCRLAQMSVNANKCVSVLQNLSGSVRRPAIDLNPVFVHAEIGMEEIPMEMVPIYRGMQICFYCYENSKSGQKALGSVLEARTDWLLRARGCSGMPIRITQKLYALKMLGLPRIDSRMKCADLGRSHLQLWVAKIPRIFVGWFDVHGIHVELFQISWMGFSFLFYRDRQNTLVI
jgi:hypothetical protein